VLAYATVRRPGTLVAGHPDNEGLGIGAQLLRWAERRELELGRSHHRQWIGAANEPARRLLTAAGYRYARSYRRMVLAFDSVDPDPPLPAGIGLRPLDVAADARRLNALDAARFAGNADFQPEPLHAFTEEHLQAHDADPALSLVAVENDRAVGFLLSRRYGDRVGFVDILAVQPDRQQRGIATAMLRRAFAQYRAANLAEAGLGVASDNPRAVWLYERLGMRVKFRCDT
jgi:mycothiol synthase